MEIEDGQVVFKEDTIFTLKKIHYFHGDRDLCL